MYYYGSAQTNLHHANCASVNVSSFGIFPMTEKGIYALMRKSKLIKEQIAFALCQAENGARIDCVCDKLGITMQTLYLCNMRYVVLGDAKLRCLERLG